MHQTLSMTAAIVPKVTCDLTFQGAEGVKDHPHLKHLPLADPTFDKLGQIDLLIGCNCCRTYLSQKSSEAIPTNPWQSRLSLDGFSWDATHLNQSNTLLNPLWLATLHLLQVLMKILGDRRDILPRHLSYSGRKVVLEHSLPSDSPQETRLSTHGRISCTGCAMFLFKRKLHYTHGLLATFSRCKERVHRSWIR